MLKRLLLCLLVLLPASAWATDLPHAYVEVTSAQTTTAAAGSPVDIPGAAISSASLVSAGIADSSDTVIIVRAEIKTTGTSLMGVRTLHGTTAFGDSYGQVDSQTAGENYVYSWMRKWTKVAGEGIKCQFGSDGVSTASVNFVTISVLGVGSLPAGAYQYAEDTADASLTTTPTDGASVTFSPSTTGNWLVMSYTFTDITSTTLGYTSSIVRSGEASSTTPGFGIEQGSTTANVAAMAGPRVYSLTASTSNTFKEQSAGRGTADTRLLSVIFALDLSQFQTVAQAYTDGSVNLSTTDYATNLQTTSFDAPGTGDVLVLGAWVFGRANTGNECESRMQVDSADIPAGVTAANNQIDFGTDATDAEPIFHSAIKSLDDTAHTINLDGSVDANTGTPTGNYRQIVAISMALASAAATNPSLRLLRGVGR